MASARLPSGRPALARLARALAMVAAVVLAAAPAEAQRSEASYRVSDVEVEATAADAVAAQALAMEQGRRLALDRLLERLAPDGSAPAAGDLPVDDLVASLEILDETIGPSSYAATLAVAFDRAAVDRALNERGVAVAPSPAEPLVVVPLWQTGEGLRLWDAGNAWKAAWDRAVDPAALAPFIVPLGDLQDLALLNPDQAARADRAALQALAQRYDAAGAVVARLEGGGVAGSGLEVAARRYGDGAGEPYRAPVRRGPDEPLALSLERAVGEMQAAYDARVRSRTAAARAPSQRLVLTTAVGGIDAWGEVMRLLQGLAEVESAEVRRFSPREATLELNVAGGRAGLEAALGERGWRLSPGEDDDLRLERAGAGEAGSSAL